MTWLHQHFRGCYLMRYRTSPSLCHQNNLAALRPIGQTSNGSSLQWALPVLAPAYRLAEVEWRRGLTCQMMDGGGTWRHCRSRSNSGLKSCYLTCWSGCVENTLEGLFPMMPDWNRSGWWKLLQDVCFFILLMDLCRSFSTHFVSARGGIYTAVTTMDINSISNQYGLHNSIKYSTSGEHKEFNKWTLAELHHVLLIMKQTPPPLLFLDSSFDLSAQNHRKLLQDPVLLETAKFLLDKWFYSLLTHVGMKSWPSVHSSCCPRTAH